MKKFILLILLGIVIIFAGIKISQAGIAFMRMTINNKGPSIPFFYIPDSTVAIPDFNISTFIDDSGKQWIYWCSNLRYYPEVFLNIKNTDGTWEYATSQMVISSSGFPLFGNTYGSVAMGDVLYNSTAIFYNTIDSTYYKYVMYIVYQPEVTGGTAGAIYISFSNNGTSWTFMRHTTFPGAPQRAAYGNEPVMLVEALGAITDGTNIKVIGVEGDYTHYIEANNDLTQTTLATAAVGNPANFTINGEISATGMFRPNKTSFPAMYNLFINLGVAYDSVNDYFYIGRGIPYGADPYSGSPYPVPCHANCFSGLATLPVRVQIYKMAANSFDNINNILTGTWTLVTDLGHKSGYKYNAPSCTPLDLQGAQGHINGDLETVSFLRNKHGYLHSNKIAYFASAKESIDMTQSDCVSGDDGYIGLYKYKLP